MKITGVSARQNGLQYTLTFYTEVGPVNLASKLNIKEGQSLLIMNEPETYRERLRPLPEGAKYISDAGEGMADFVQVFVKSLDDINRWVPRAIRVLKHDGLFWVTYPKKTSGVTTDIKGEKNWKVMREAGLSPVERVSISDIWIAVRFRPVEKTDRLRIPVLRLK